MSNLKYNVYKFIMVIIFVCIFNVLISNPSYAQGTKYPTFKIDDSVTSSVVNIKSEIKLAHSKLPYNVQSMINSVTFYQKQDAILGYANGRDMSINTQYLKNPLNKKHLRGLYYHEMGHIVDYNSFGVKYYSKNLYNKSNQEYGRYDITTGVNYINTKNSYPGYRTKSLIVIKPNKNYEIKTNSSKDMIVVFYDKNKNITRFGYGLYEKFKTTSNEKYISIYTVDANKNLNSLSIRECSELNSLSRDNSFKSIYLSMGYSNINYMRDRHEAFAQAYSNYVLYKSKYITYNEIKNKKMTKVIPYLDKVHKTKYKLKGYY